MHRLGLRRKLALGLAVLVVLVAAVSYLASGWSAQHAAGFQVVLTSSGQVLISDDDISSYNATSRQLSLTPGCIDKMKEVDLYHKAFTVSLDGRYLDNGSFWSSMDSMPAPRGLAILDIVTLQNGHSNFVWMEACYPSGYYPNCQDPSFLADIAAHFQSLGKLVH